MKTSNFFISILLCFAVSSLYSQEATVSTSQTQIELGSSSFSWKPFTIELNTSTLGHGFAIEKQLTQNTSLRVGVSSDFKREYYSNTRGYKINFGALYNVLNFHSLSLRSGLELGMRKDSYYGYPGGGIGGFIICGMPTAEDINLGFLEIPLLLQFRISKRFSLDLGAKLLYQKPMEFTEMISREKTDFSYYADQMENNLMNYHLALRYTFTD